MTRFQRTVLLLSFAGLAGEHAIAQDVRQPARTLARSPAAAASPQGAVRTRYLELVNRSDRRIEAVAMASPGSGDFQDKPFKVPVQPDGDARMFGHTGRGCDYSVQVTFQDGQRLTYDAVDLCRQGSLTITSAPTTAPRLTMR